MESKDTNLNGNPYLGIFPSFPPLHPQQMGNLPWVDMDVKEGHLDHKYGPPHSYPSQISHPLHHVRKMVPWKKGGPTGKRFLGNIFSLTFSFFGDELKRYHQYQD